TPSTTASVPSPPAPAPAARPARSSGGPRSGGSRHRGVRRAPTLPPGVFDASGEADRHLLGDRRNCLVVDGYNVARAAWSGLAPEEERRRLTALLEEVQARSGGRVLLVFDGDDAVTAPVSSKHVRIRFSS